MGPKKKGGKANKLARMTDEQRERYLQHRAAIEEETRRRKEQLIATFMRNKLKREEAFTRINSAKINQHWRHILRKIKCAELREDVENLWHSFERIMDQKERQKDELLSSLEVAERQYSDTLQSHMEVVERLIEVHSEHVNNLKSLFNSQLLEHLHNATDEKALIHITYKKENKRLDVIRMTMEMDLQSPERQLYKYEKTNKISEMKKQYKEYWEILISERERALEDIWQRIQDCLNVYADNTAAKRKTVQKLQKMDQDWLQTLADIQRTSRRVSQMKELAENKMNEISENNSNLRRQRDSLLHCYKVLVERVGKDNKKDDEKFEHLVITSDGILKDLSSLRDKGDKALGLITLCKRLETRIEQKAAQATLKEEQELNIAETAGNPPEKIDINDKKIHEYFSDDDDSFISDLEEREMRTFGKLTNFWKKYNKVLLDTSKTRMERDMLALENQQLRSTLQNYLSEMARVDSCGAPTGHRIANNRPRTTQLSGFRTGRKLPQRPVSSISWSRSRSVGSRGGSPGSKQSASRASSAAAVKATVQSDHLSLVSSDSNQWSI
ncbi:Dynein regulatory complex subunit 2 [Frankliniella fusca]|uniref:Dynein regulatory complex subunit 2 n=1 Tax=Frankliniella fusca TaxID=407009 RepID=A0AAE1LDH1_9NEOP|nr:Dynein regulatory complex subunit 2 [Frankliniella fusca]